MSSSTFTYLLKTSFSDLLDRRLRIFLYDSQDSPVINIGGLSWLTSPFVITELANAFFLLNDLPDS